MQAFKEQSVEALGLKGGVRCGVVWCGVVWCGVVWCGVVWCGVVWCGVVWCGIDIGGRLGHHLVEGCKIKRTVRATYRRFWRVFA